MSLAPLGDHMSLAPLGHHMALAPLGHRLAPLGHHLAPLLALAPLAPRPTEHSRVAGEAAQSLPPHGPGGRGPGPGGAAARAARLAGLHRRDHGEGGSGRHSSINRRFLLGASRTPFIMPDAQGTNCQASTELRCAFGISQKDLIVWKLWPF